MLFYVHFHVLKKDLLQFAPDYSDTGFGKFGCHPWYEIYVFPSSEGDDVEMTYQSKRSLHYLRYSLTCVITDHNKCVKIIHEKNEINISKTTHAGHSYTAKTAREFGASVDSVKALGNWSDSDAYCAVYDRALAKEAMWGAAMFDARWPERYCLSRASLVRSYPL